MKKKKKILSPLDLIRENALNNWDSFSDSIISTKYNKTINDVKSVYLMLKILKKPEIAINKILYKIKLKEDDIEYFVNKNFIDLRDDLINYKENQQLLIKEILSDAASIIDSDIEKIDKNFKNSIFEILKKINNLKRMENSNINEINEHYNRKSILIKSIILIICKNKLNTELQIGFEKKINLLSLIFQNIIKNKVIILNKHENKNLYLDETQIIKHKNRTAFYEKYQNLKKIRLIKKK